jgi:hypothetical protein
MQFMQKRLLQQGVSTASQKISRQIGHSHLSSDKLLALKLLNLCRAGDLAASWIGIEN